MDVLCILPYDRSAAFCINMYQRPNPGSASRGMDAFTGKKMSQTVTALIVEDDAKIRRVLRNLLEDDGFAVIEAEDATGALDMIANQSPSLVTLDIQLGRDNGVDVLRDIRKISRVPVIMITGKDDVIDRVVGLEIGADDYIAKPFHVREVLARVRAVMRRHAGGPTPKEAHGQPREDKPRYEVDGLTVIPDRLEVIGRDGRQCDLTTADLSLFQVFLERPKRALSRDQLMDLIGGPQWSPLDRTIDNQVARLRKKIERDPSNPMLIKTVRGIGYMMADDVVQMSPQNSGAKSA